MKHVLLYAVLAAAACAAAVPSSAQTRPSRNGGGGSELFAGVSYLFRDYTHTQLNSTSGGMPGWNLAYARPHMFGRMVGLTVDTSGHYEVGGGFFSPQIYFLTAGPRFQMRLGRDVLFAKVTGGGMFASSDVIAQTRSHARPIVDAGGGLDLPTHLPFRWRLNVDWIYGSFDTNDTNQISQIVQNNFRISTGPVFRF